MKSDELDDCGCCQPCGIFPTRAKTSKFKNMSLGQQNYQRQEPPRTLHDLHNFEILPRAPARRENCRGVGQYPSQDCHCIRVVNPHAKNQEEDKDIEECENEYNQEELKDYFNKLMAAPNEDYKVCKHNKDPYKFNCCKEDGRNTWLEYPPEDYTSSTMKRVSEQYMKAQQQSSKSRKRANYEQAMNLPWKDPKLVDIHGRLLNLTNSKHFDNTQNSPKEKSLFKKSPSFGCPTQSLTFSNKKCRWGGCHGPVKTKCLDDPNKGHMFMNECQVWHCGGCCKMERDHVAYESMHLLRQSDIALENKKIQNNLLLKQQRQQFQGEY